VTVPLYDTLGHDSVAYICNHGELAAVCCSIAVLPTLLSQLHRCPSVQLVVVYPNAGIPLDSVSLPAVPPGSSARIVTLDQVSRCNGTRFDV
jgi:long-chain acyl-CoA synthetase